MSDLNDQTNQGSWPPQAASGPPAGWYPDPWDDRRRRYWDGHAWTGDVAVDPAQGGGWAPNGGGGGWPPSQAAGPATWQGGQAQPGQGYSGQGYSGQGVGGQGFGGWGGPAASAPWYTAPNPARPVGTGRGGRVHVAFVALIAAVAVLAGIGIGSQVNSTSNPSAAGNGGGSGFTAPFGGNGGGSGTGTGGSTQLTPAQQAVVSSVDKSVVDINTELGYQSGAAAGTGMVLSADGVVLTNNHVIDGATSISVTVVSTGKTYKATVVGDDVTQDVAVIQMQGASGLTPITVATGSVKVGDQVVAIGNAGGAGGTPSAVSGSVTDLNRQITASDQNGSNAEQLSGLIQTDAPIQAGDSGGPLVNAKGQVIGMDTAASAGNQFNSGSGSEGFAIPIAQAEQIAGQIQKGQSSDKIHIGETGFLGVSVAAGSGLPGSIGSGNGAQVNNVISGSPADKAGITGGDTITAVDGTTITSATDLTNALRAHHPGDSVAITYTDQSGASHTSQVTLTTGPAA